MTENSNSKFAILGMLGIRPMSGYEIKKSIERSIGFFWSESFGQIYPVLKQLVAEGLANAQNGDESRDSRRKVYEISTQGEKALREWLAFSARTNLIRSEALLKIFFGGQADPETTRKHIERELTECRRKLVAVNKVEQALAQRSAGRQTENDFHHGLTVAYGKKMLIALIDWCETSLRLCSWREAVGASKEELL